jgi:ribonuclease Z
MDKLLDYLHWDIEVRRSHMVDRKPPTVAVTEIEEGRVMEAGGVTVSAFLVEHDPVKPAFGYRFDGGGRSVVISGDTRPCENLMRWSRDVDCLIHECCEMTKTSWFPGCGWPTLEEKIRDLSSYHTQPDDLGRVVAGARARKLAVTHLMPGSEPHELEKATRKHYAGPLVIGTDLLEV